MFGLEAELGALHYYSTWLYLVGTLDEDDVRATVDRMPSQSVQYGGRMLPVDIGIEW